MQWWRQESIILFNNQYLHLYFISQTENHYILVIRNYSKTTLKLLPYRRPIITNLYIFDMTYTGYSSIAMLKYDMYS